MQQSVGTYLASKKVPYFGGGFTSVAIDARISGQRG
jgi:hypothetical protein